MKTFILSIFMISTAILKAQIITTVAGNGSQGFSGEGGLATNAELGSLCGVGIDNNNNIYIADCINNVIEIIDTNGILKRFAGNGFSGLSGDGGEATNSQLELYLTLGIVSDSIGNIYFADGGRIRKVNTSGIITIAGNGSFGYSGDGGQATDAVFRAPTGICFDKKNNIYIADDQNSNIRKVDTSGIISTFAGSTIGFSGDGGMATDAQMNSPEGIISDDLGNIYFGDLGTNRVRKIDTIGVINTIAGGNESMSRIVACEGCPALDISLYGSVGVIMDQSGNLYASAIEDNVIQKITQNSLAYTVAGTGIAGFSGDGGPASGAMLHYPQMICLDTKGNLLITDPGNYRLRKIWTGTNYVRPGPIYILNKFYIYPNPITQKNFTCKIITDTNEKASIIIWNIIGQEVFSSTCSTNTVTNFSLNVPPGVYFVTATTKDYKVNKKIVVE